MQIPLEDLATDILSKAASGLALSPQTIADRCGLSATEVGKNLSDPAASSHTHQVATVLGIAPEKLAAIAAGTYQPAPVHLDGIAQFNTPYDDMTVNSFLVWDPSSHTAAAFDTGSDCDAMLAFATDHNLRIEQIFLTHAHGDHIYDLDRLLEKTGAHARTPEKEPVDGVESFSPGAHFQIAKLQIETRLTFGHSTGGVTYVIHGLGTPVAICGDAIFAGSMGGGRVSYADALRTNKEEILSLPDSTILCPGHGPMTTVGEERKNNPFF